MAGIPKAREMDKRLVSQQSVELQTYLKSGTTAKSIDMDVFVKHCRHELENFAVATEFFYQPKVVKIKLLAFQRRHQALDLACRVLTGRTIKNVCGTFPKRTSSRGNGTQQKGEPSKKVEWTERRKNVVVAFGDASFSSCGKGQAPVPIRGLKQRLTYHTSVCRVDEYFTSQKCATCRNKMKDIYVFDEKTNQRKKVHGVRVCTHSSEHEDRARTYVDRDINAAWNIRNIFMHSIWTRGKWLEAFRPDPRQTKIIRNGNTISNAAAK